MNTKTSIVTICTRSDSTQTTNNDSETSISLTKTFQNSAFNSLLNTELRANHRNVLCSFCSHEEMSFYRFGSINQKKTLPFQVKRENYCMEIV